jgi:TolB-like protein
MKKKIFLVLLGLAVSAAFLEAQTIDEAIMAAAIKISRDLPANSRAAVINFRSDSEALNSYVIDELHGAILRNRMITPVKPDQSQLQSIRGESHQNIGRLLGVQYIVSGSAERIGSEYRLLFNAVDTNAEIKSQYSAALNPQNDTHLASLLGISPATAASASSRRPQQADIKNNWISGDISYAFPYPFGVGVSYERMLGSKISIGTDVYVNSFLFVLEDVIYGIDAFFRFYPQGKAFFMGVALGYLGSRYFYSARGVGELDVMAITPEIGWKIDVGKEGGFYLQPGLRLGVMVGEFRHYSQNEVFVNMSGKLYFGMGYAF